MKKFKKLKNYNNTRDDHDSNKNLKKYILQYLI